MQSEPSRGNSLTAFLLKDSLLQRTLFFMCGMFIMALGVDLSVKANLGISPISSVPYVYSLKFPLTLGQTTIIMNVLFVGLQILLLKKDYPWVQLVQIPVVLLFGLFIDLVMPMLSWIEPANYASQLFFCLLSCGVIALGVFIEVTAKVTYMPGEGLAMALVRKFGFEFGKTKIGLDSTLVAIGVVSSLVFFGSIHGTREGTVLAAVLVGYLVRFFSRVIPVPAFLQPQQTSPGQAELPEPDQMVDVV